jgi:hypothetical protein
MAMSSKLKSRCSVRELAEEAGRIRRLEVIQPLLQEGELLIELLDRADWVARLVAADAELRHEADEAAALGLLNRVQLFQQLLSVGSSSLAT